MGDIKSSTAGFEQLGKPGLLSKAKDSFSNKISTKQVVEACFWSVFRRMAQEMAARGEKSGAEVLAKIDGKK